LELDDSLAEAHTALGLVRLEFDRNWAAAESEFKRAIELNPSYPTAHQFYSWYLIAITRYDKSVAEGKRALELDPLSIFRIADLGVIFQLVHRPDDAILQLQKAVDGLPPGYRTIFVLHDIEGYEHNEIAGIVGCSIGNSKSQLHKARVRLRKLLRPETVHDENGKGAPDYRGQMLEILTAHS
jgi:DNA-directed RNA polymerase specialized sigma24 family protein